MLTDQNGTAYKLDGSGLDVTFGGDDGVVSIAGGATNIKEQPDGTNKVSLRSKGATDVGAIATGFGGGGHQFAAGYTSDLGAEATVAALVEVLVRDRAGGRR